MRALRRRCAASHEAGGGSLEWTGQEPKIQRGGKAARRAATWLLTTLFLGWFFAGIRIIRQADEP
eukprot:7764875-Alexandrium_andersonii.AAC.1